MSTVRRLVSLGSLSFVTVLVALAACSGGDDTAPGGPPAVGPTTSAPVPPPTSTPTTSPTTAPTTLPGTPIDKGVVVEMDITRAAGGTIDLQDGAKLVIPPNALRQDTKVKVAVPSDQKGPGSALTYVIEPTGLLLDVPATLVVPYQDGPNGPPPAIVMDSSVANPTYDVAGEKSNWEYPPIKGRDTTAHTLSVEVHHFSFWKVFVAIDDLAYLVMDIPAKYLLPGDLLFTLTTPLKTVGETQVVNQAGADWNPGHVGVFTDVPYPLCSLRNATGKITEATPPKVQKSSVGAFHDDLGHVYMGARRPKAGYTDAERTTVATTAEAQVGSDYALTGDGAISQGREFSCVGLADFALDKVGKSGLTGFQKGTVATPIELFRVTEPVREITVEEGIEMTLPVNAIIVHPDSPYVGLTMRGYYCVPGKACAGSGSNAAKLSATGLPPLATFNETSFQKAELKWTPQRSDVGKTYTVTFKLDATLTATVAGSAFSLGPVSKTETLTIKVVGCPHAGPITAYFDQATFSTTYTCPIDNADLQPVTMTWSGPSCGSFSPNAPVMSSEKAPVASMTWAHPHPPCPTSTDHADNEILLDIAVGQTGFTCSYQGAASGVGPKCGPKVK